MIWICAVVALLQFFFIAWLLLRLAQKEEINDVELRSTFEKWSQKQDIIVKELQELRFALERNTDTTQIGSRRIEVFGNQLDGAFKYHKEEVQDLLDRLQAKSTAELIALEKARLSPEELMKFKVAQAEIRDKKEKSAFDKQQAELRKQQVEAVT